jgi:hypothetical protein
MKKIIKIEKINLNKSLKNSKPEKTNSNSGKKLKKSPSEKTLFNNSKSVKKVCEELAKLKNNSEIYKPLMKLKNRSTLNFKPIIDFPVKTLKKK